MKGRVPYGPSPMPDPPNATIAALFDELGRPLRARRRRRPPRPRLSQRRQVGPRGAALRRRHDARGQGHRAARHRQTLEEKILALLDTGTIPAVEKLRAAFPPGLIDLTRLPGLGPKRARKLYDELGIDSLEALRAAAETQQLRDVRGFGREVRGDRPRGASRPAPARRRARACCSARRSTSASAIVEALRAHPASDRVELAGSARRLADAVKDLDIIATASDPPALLAALRRARRHRERLIAGRERRARAHAHRRLRVDLRVVEPDQFGNLLQHFTGSKAHNMALREAAVRRGLHVSEYGLLDDATGETHRCATEEEVYALLGLPWIPPELRENRGELALRDGDVPALIEQGDLKGDLHMHTTLSDGRADAEEMARARAGAGPRVHRDHRPLGDARLRQPRHPRRAARADRGDPRARRAPGRHPRPHRHRDEHRHRRHARLRRRPAGAARLGHRLGAHVVRASAARR